MFGGMWCDLLYVGGGRTWEVSDRFAMCLVSWLQSSVENCNVIGCCPNRQRWIFKVVCSKF